MSRNGRAAEAIVPFIVPMRDPQSGDFPGYFYEKQKLRPPRGALRGGGKYLNGGYGGNSPHHHFNGYQQSAPEQN